MARLFEWLDRFGEPADVAGLRAAYPAVGWHTFEEWATAQDWERLEPGTVALPRSTVRHYRVCR
jgi:hypothetical protein